MAAPPSPFPNADALQPGVTRHEPRAAPRRRTPDERVREIRGVARALGFVAVGFTHVAPFEADAGHLSRWRARGWQGEMRYLEAPADRTSPRALLGSAQTLIAVALPHSRDVPPTPALGAMIARYAQGADYHGVLKQRLRELADRIADLAGPVLARVCVDTAPLTEHAAAARAGVGFVGRNTLTIVPGVGSYVLLGELLVDLALPPDEPAAPRCGRCSRCLDSCPTGAFAGPYQLDARRCISYLTIELRGPIPNELRPLMGQRVFGCDICQQVCPYNHRRRAPLPDEQLRSRSELATPALVDLLWLGSAAYRRLTRGTALERVSRSRLARNAAVALGNTAEPAAIEPVVRALAAHPNALVRGHAAWALGRLDPSARESLERATTDDPDPFVRDEARIALRGEWER